MDAGKTAWGTAKWQLEKQLGVQLNGNRKNSWGPAKWQLQDRCNSSAVDSWGQLMETGELGTAGGQLGKAEGRLNNS